MGRSPFESDPEGASNTRGAARGIGGPSPSLGADLDLSAGRAAHPVRRWPAGGHRNSGCQLPDRRSVQRVRSGHVSRLSNLAHTFSVVARDPQTGEMGVAVQSHWFSVGSVVAWAEAGVGAVATQALVEISYGPLGLDLLREGKPPAQALSELLASDEGREMRQVSLVDAQGLVATHTGTRCIADAGHETGQGFSVQANMMARPGVWPAMAQAYSAAEGDLAERLLAALEAGQAAGGDIRGRQSASILIVGPVSSGRPWDDRVMDLRVEDHWEPIRELRRLVHLHRAYRHMNRGDEFLGAGDVEAALGEYSTASAMVPDNEELPFWHAVTLTDLGRVDEALPLFRDVFARNGDWATLLERLPRAGLLVADPETVRRIVSVRDA